MLGINVNFEEKKMCGEKYIKTTKTKTFLPQIPTFLFAIIYYPLDFVL